MSTSRWQLIREPRLAYTKLLRRYCLKHRDGRTRRKVRDHLRKRCVDQELQVPTRNGFTMCVSPRDYISHRIYFFGDYDPSMTHFISYHLPEGGVAMDLGAERGWFTLLMARQVGPQGAVHAFEALPDTAEKLRTNAGLNQYDWVQVHECAVTDRDGSLHFQTSTDQAAGDASFLADCGGAGHIASEAGPETIEVAGVALDRYLPVKDLDRIDLIKLDLEGAEVQAFKGAAALIQRCKPILLIEYNKSCLKRAGTDWETLDALLETWGYDRYTLPGLKKLDLSAYANKDDEAAVINVYAFPRRS